MDGEFKMLAPVVAPELSCNYEELKAYLTDALSEYKAMVVTEDAISSAKSARAKLNKLADNINSYRINIKKQILATYDEDFAPKCNELVQMTKDTSESIDTQIKAFEQREWEAKVQELKAFYDAFDGDEAKEYCPWEKLWNPKWGNKSYSLDQAKQDISIALAETESDLVTIRTIGKDDTAYLLDYYKGCRSISATARKASDLQELRRREAEAKRKAEEAAKEKEAEIAEGKREADKLEQPDEPKTLTVVFRVTGTRDQLADLGQYMRENGLKFGRV